MFVRNIITIVLLLMTIQSFSQAPLGPKSTRSASYSEISEIKVIYSDSLSQFHPNKKPVGYFVNGTLVNKTIISGLDKDEIETIMVEKEYFEINGKVYFGKLLIEMKSGSLFTKESGYNPNYMPLREIANKYLILDACPLIFQIDENVINQDCNEYLVDEKFILKIELSKIWTSDNDTAINLIKLVTKKPENIEKENEFRIK